MSPDVTLRPMRWWDIEPVMDLERELFPEDAWSPGMFWSELAETTTRYYVVAQVKAPEPADLLHTGAKCGEDAEIVGYAGLRAVGQESEVQTIAVRRSRWGGGVGELLLTDLLTEAVRRGCREVLLEVRVDNDRAQRLYGRFGFEPIGIRRGYYQPAGVDALIMKLPDVGAWRSRTQHLPPDRDGSEKGPVRG